MMDAIQELQLGTHMWREVNFPGYTASDQLHGMTEELGELSHAHLKQKQGIRGTAEHFEAEEKDALGDLFIYMCGYASARGFDLSSIFHETAEKVVKRDWITDPQSGGEVAPG